jgi:hypothetical protein
MTRLVIYHPVNCVSAFICRLINIGSEKNILDKIAFRWLTLRIIREAKPMVKISFIVPFLGLTLLLVGCSGGNAGPIIPFSGNNGAPIHTGINTTTDDTSNHRLWGIWDISFDPVRKEIITNASRSSHPHYDITPMLLPPLCLDCLEMDLLEYQAPDNVKINVTIKNPYSLSGYDIRGIVMSNSTELRLANADGWTSLWDDGGAVTINPFKAFAKGETQRKFAGEAKHEEEYDLYFTKFLDVWLATFVVDASWPENCKEPYEFAKFYQQTIYSIEGFSGYISIDVHDWQGDVTSVVLEAEEITGEQSTPLYNLSHGSWKSDTWAVKLINDTGAAAGQYEVKFIAKSADSVLESYYFVTLGITNPTPPPPTWDSPKAISVYNAYWKFYGQDTYDRAVQAINKALEYGLDAIVLQDECVVGGFVDGCYDFVDYPDILDNHPYLHFKNYFCDPFGCLFPARMSPYFIKSMLNQIVNAAKDNGLKVYVWQHDFRYPIEWEDVYPDWFIDEAPYTKDPRWWEFITLKHNQFFTEFPGIDGIMITTGAETTYKLTDVGDIVDLTHTLYSVCQTFGKTLIMRPFGEYDAFKDAMDLLPPEIKPSVVVMDKITKTDWHFFLPINEYLDDFPDHPLVVELDLCGEYWGCSEIIAALPDRLPKWLDAANDNGAVGLVGRIDRGRHTLFGTPNELNLYLFGNYVPGSSVEPYLDAWCTDKYPGHIGTCKKVLTDCEDILARTFYIEGDESGTELSQWFLGGQTKYFWLYHKNKSWYRQLEMFAPEGTPFPYSYENSYWMYVPDWVCPGHEAVMPDDEAIMDEKEGALSNIQDSVDLLEYELPGADLTEMAKMTKTVVEAWKYMAEGYCRKWDCDHEEPGSQVDYEDWKQRIEDFAAVVESNWGPEFYRWREYQTPGLLGSPYCEGLAPALIAFPNEPDPCWICYE